ncbi:MAG: TonB-dependent receptor [Phenylobacterium sp.]|uniref:TonB-dependent receptor family protein n=1 Tax=Phenylobacterium sp. TaxID=1871053 RepID=UPI0027376445|nr:TonB-dependent receptor [Phenylobacterium sp.]MDP3174558.1 TonB-dependent receptor [Phenylobacterium sp.]
MKTLLLASVAALALAAPALSHAAEADRGYTVDSVIVTATPNSEDPPVVAEARARLSETPGSVAVISAESYKARFTPNLAEILRDVPGVYAEKKWGGDLRLSIRGSGIGNSTHNRGLLLAQDGVPWNEADGAGDFQLVDPMIARYTEVYKGGNALRFGGSLLGGAINIVTPSGRNNGAETLIRADGGSFGNYRVHAEAARVWGDWDGFAGVTGAEQTGFRQNSDGQQQYFSMNVGRSFGDENDIRLIINSGYVHQEINGAVTLASALNTPKLANPTNLAQNYQRDMGTVRGSLQSHWRLSESTTLDSGLYGTWKQLDHPIFAVVDNESRNWGAFGRFNWKGELGGKRADAFYGLYARTGDNDARQWVNVRGSKGALTARAKQNAKAFDVFGEGRLFVTDQLALVAGGTYGQAKRDYTGYRVPGQAATFDANIKADYDWFAPRIGLLWEDEGGAQVYANVTKSVEPPNFSALAPQATGFTALKPQEAWTGEVGARGKMGPLTFDVVVYRAELQHELLTFQVNPALGIPAATFNAGDTIHQGVEAGVDWQIAEGLRLKQTYTWNDFKFDGDKVYGNNQLPVVPEHLYRAELRYQNAAGWFVAPSVQWTPKDTWVDYANTLKSPSFALLNLNAGWRFDNGISVFLDARNLTDEVYISNFSAVTDARIPTVNTAVFFPGEGRSVFGGIAYAF